MVPLEKLKPGTRVKIVDRWVTGCRQNPDGLMDKYLGQIVTVSQRNRDDVFIEEDKEDGFGPWFWSKYCFEYIVEEEYEDFVPASDSEILSFILEGG